MCIIWTAQFRHRIKSTVSKYNDFILLSILNTYKVPVPYLHTRESLVQLFFPPLWSSEVLFFPIDREVRFTKSKDCIDGETVTQICLDDDMANGLLGWQNVSAVRRRRGSGNNELYFWSCYHFTRWGGASHSSLGLNFSIYKIAIVNFSFPWKCFELLREPSRKFAMKPALLLTAHQSILVTFCNFIQCAICNIEFTTAYSKCILPRLCEFRED